MSGERERVSEKCLFSAFLNKPGRTELVTELGVPLHVHPSWYTPYTPRTPTVHAPLAVMPSTSVYNSDLGAVGLGGFRIHLFQRFTAGSTSRLHGARALTTSVWQAKCKKVAQNSVLLNFLKSELPEMRSLF